MTLEEARAALLAEILDGGAEPANTASNSGNLLDKSALQQIVNGCFVKLQQVRLLRCDSCEKPFHKRSRLMIHYFDAHVNEDLEESDIPTGARVDVEKSTPDVENLCRTNCSGLKLHPCNICDESYAFKVDMLIHKLKHSGKEPQECEICQKHFLNKKQLNRHIKESHAAEKLYTCDICYKQFQCLKYLKNHKKRHTDIKPYSCEFCKKKFANREYMMRHRRTHTGERPYICLCGRQFPFYTGLKYHRCTYANRTQPHVCEICKERFYRKKQWTRHMRVRHMIRENLYSCSVCDRKFTKKRSLIEHINIHEGKKPHVCEICKERFYRKEQLTRHMIVHKGEKDIPDLKCYECKICGRSFSRSYLVIHSRIHTGDQPYQCAICDKKFHRKSYLTRHESYHTNVKPYVCSYCKKSFRQKCDLTIHIRMHTGEKPYQCELCKKTFSHKPNLTTHKRTCMNNKQ